MKRVHKVQQVQVKDFNNKSILYANDHYLHYGNSLNRYIDENE